MGFGSPFLHNIVNVFCLETAAKKVTNALCPHFAKSVLDHNVPKFIKEGGYYMSHLLWDVLRDVYLKLMCMCIQSTDLLILWLHDGES